IKSSSSNKIKTVFKYAYLSDQAARTDLIKSLRPDVIDKVMHHAFQGRQDKFQKNPANIERVIYKYCGRQDDPLPVDDTHPSAGGASKAQVLPGKAGAGSENCFLLAR